MFIRPEEYSSTLAFGSEIERIFSKRIFVGSQVRIPVENSYRSYIIGDRALVTRNSAGSYHTLDNVCLHRGSLLLPVGYGSGDLRCRYHSWAYDSLGVLRQAPLCEISSIQERKLASFPTKAEFGLIFADLSGCELSMGAPLNALTAIGVPRNGQLTPFFNSEMLHEANWKLLVENVVEAYHVSFLHGPTLVKQGYSSASDISYGSAESCTWHTITPKETSEERIRRFVPGYQRWYAHAYIPPNLFVAVTDGLIVYVGHFLPTDPHSTILEFELFETPRLASMSNAVRQYFTESAVKFCFDTLEEDKEILHLQHQGLRCKRDPVQIQAIEPRVLQFHKYYREAMDGFRE